MDGVFQIGQVFILRFKNWCIEVYNGVNNVTLFNFFLKDMTILT